MKAQGYDVQDNVLFQDNKSSILLEKNGKALSSKRTKHISIWYFFITDQVNKEEVSVVWCPMGDMIGDYETKPLHGALFCKFRDQIMAVVPAQDPGPGKTNRNIGKLHIAKPSKGKEKSMVPPGKGRHHRSVLGIVKCANGAQTDVTHGICHSNRQNVHKGRSLRSQQLQPGTHVH
jgi:hypothetical protein